MNSYYTRNGGNIPPAIQTVLTAMQQTQTNMEQISACVVQNIPSGGGGGNTAPKRFNVAFFACELSDENRNFMSLALKEAENYSQLLIFGDLNAIKNTFGEGKTINAPICSEQAFSLREETSGEPIIVDEKTYNYNVRIHCTSTVNDMYSLRSESVSVNNNILTLKTSNSNVFIQYTFPEDTKSDEMKKIKDWLIGFKVTGKQLKEIFSNTPQSRCDEIAELLDKYSDKFGINTPLRMAHFLGQIGTETASPSLTKLEESTCYSSKSRIKEIFGKVKYCDLFEGYESDLTVCNGSQPMSCTPNLTSITSSLIVKDKYVGNASHVLVTFHRIIQGRF